MQNFTETLTHWGSTLSLPALAFVVVFVGLTMLFGLLEKKSKRKAERSFDQLRRETDFSRPIRLR